MPKMMLTLSFWQRLLEWDKNLFLTLNHRLANPVFDAVLPWFRESLFWVPLYLFILTFVLLNYGVKGLWWVVAFLSTVALTDLTGTYVFKETVQRIRPCNEPSLLGQVRLLIRSCPGGYSFLSNHAANHFGLATFMVCTFRSIFAPWIYLAFLWAFAVAFAQVYVGVHYPFDLAAGTLLGVGAGYLTAAAFRHFAGPLPPVI